MTAASTFSETYAARVAQTEIGIDAFCNELVPEDSDEFTRAALDGYTALLRGPGKRLRGVLAIAGYELGCELYSETDGTSADDAAIASGTAAAIEALHACLLGFDDMADRADLRRGLPTVHTRMQAFLEEKNVPGDTAQQARSYTENAGLIVQHEAQAVILSLPVPPERVRYAAYILNKGLARTGHGQGRDMQPPGFGMGVERALQATLDKTAHYTFTLPLQVGAVLAGTPLASLHDFEPYALFSGLAFQVRDDVLGILGDPTITGKDTLSDIKEGKETLLVALARERTDERGQQILRATLGNMALEQADAAAFLDVLHQTGSIDLANTLVDHLASQAVDSIPPHWPERHTQFFRQLALSGSQRKK